MNDIKTLVTKLRRNGVRVERARSGHWKVYDCKGSLVTVLSYSPGKGTHGVANASSLLRKLGML